jgi:uncharacterized membrane protein
MRSSNNTAWSSFCCYSCFHHHLSHFDSPSEITLSARDQPNRVRIANAAGHVSLSLRPASDPFPVAVRLLSQQLLWGLKMRDRFITGRLLSLSPFLLAMVAWSGCGPLGPVIGLGPGMDQLVTGAFFLLLGIAALKLILRSEGTGRERWARGSRPSEPRDILATRYVRGEIGREEYLEKIRDVREQSQ